jgi:NTE family protein
VAVPVRVQLALQGGGAKICALVAALEKLDEYAVARKIEITQIAGTSAGSIAGALYAAGMPMNVLRTYLEQLPLSQIEAALPTPRVKALAYAAFNRPIWNEKVVREALQALLKRQNVRTFGDIRAKGRGLFVVASDIRTSAIKVYKDDNEDVLTAVMDSCGLPFLFRTAIRGDGPLYVDGGICENLPSDTLEPYADKCGPVLGIGFPSTSAGTPHTPLEFLGSLLDASINAAMARARQRLGDRFIELPTTLTTFDISRAKNMGFGAEYQNIKHEMQRQLDRFLQTSTPRVLKKSAWDTVDVDTMTSLRRIYEAQHADVKIQIDRASFVVRANSLISDENDTDFNRADEVSHEVVFQPLQDPVHCYKVKLAFTPSSEFHQDTDWRVFDRTGSDIGAERLPVVDPVQTRPGRAFLLFYTPPLQQADNALKGPYTLVVKERLFNAMADLKSIDTDELAMTFTRAAQPIPRADLVLFVPKGYRALKLTAQANAAPGRQMNGAELAEYDVPPGFRAVGWTSSGVPPTGRIACTITFA